MLMYVPVRAIPDAAPAVTTQVQGTNDGNDSHSAQRLMPHPDLQTQIASKHPVGHQKNQDNQQPRLVV